MKKEKTITWASFIAVIGIALLAVFTFLGHSFLSGGQIGVDILVALGVAAVEVALLVVMIKARKADNDLEKWFVFEMGALGAFIVVALVAGYNFGLGHFFAVNSNKEAIQETAREDIANINRMFSDYNAFETAAINKTCNGLYNSVYSSSRRTAELNDFMKAERFDASRDGVDAYKRRVQRELIGTGYKTYVVSDSARLASIESVINSWSMISLPFQAAEMEKVSQSIGENLTRLSQGANLPEVGKNSYNRFTVGENQTATFGIDPETLGFRQALKTTASMGSGAWIAIIVINLLILFPYVTARRTIVLRGKGMEEDGGVIIK